MIVRFIVLFFTFEFTQRVGQQAVPLPVVPDSPLLSLGVEVVLFVPEQAESENLNATVHRITPTLVEQVPAAFLAHAQDDPAAGAHPLAAKQLAVGGRLRQVLPA